MPVLAQFQPGNVVSPAQAINEGAQTVGGMMSRAQQYKQGEVNIAQQRQEMDQRNWQFNLLKPVVTAEAQAKLGTALATVKGLEFDAKAQAEAAPRYLDASDSFASTMSGWDYARQQTDPVAREAAYADAKSASEDWLANFQHFGDIPNDFQGSYQVKAKQLQAVLSNRAAFELHQQNAQATQDAEAARQIAVNRANIENQSAIFQTLSKVYGTAVAPGVPVTIQSAHGPVTAIFDAKGMPHYVPNQSGSPTWAHYQITTHPTYDTSVPGQRTINGSATTVFDPNNASYETITRDNSGKVIKTERYRAFGDSGNLDSGPSGSTTSSIPSVTNADDYNRLPSGATYVDPNGVVRRKP